MSGCIGTPVNAPPETQPQHNCLTVVSAAFDPEARGSFPPARGASLALDVGIALADGLLYTLFPRGRTLPASTSVILTTAEDFQQWCEVAVACGARPALASSRNLVVTRLELPPAARGFVQVAVRVQLFRRAVRLRCSTFDAATGLATTTVSTAARFEATPHLRSLPTFFRFERAGPLPGYALNDRLFIRIAHRSANATIPLGSDGDVVPGFTASRMWSAAYELGRYLASNHDTLLMDARVIELGSGTGFVGVAAAKLGAAFVALTDLEENLSRLRESLDYNAVDPSRARAIALDWTQPTASAIFQLTPFNVLLAADCVFWPALFDPLVDTFEEFLHVESQLVVLLAVTHRLDRTALFFDTLRRRGWAAQKQEYPFTYAKSLNAAIYRLSKTPNKKLSTQETATIKARDHHPQTLD